jgi:NADPH-dependent glutamate synthase beta subunit-like oxidoreductase
MDMQAVVALVVGTVLVLSIPALLLSTDVVDRFRNALRR